MTAYREQSGRAGARVVAWAALGRDTRERLTAACQGEGAVPLLVDRPALQPAVGAAAGLALVSSVVLGGVLTMGVRALPAFGQSAVGLGAAAVLGGGVATQAAMAERSRWLRGRRSFPGGTYLFARDLLEVRGNSVRVVPTALLTGVEYVPGLEEHNQGQVELRFEGGEQHELRCDLETGVTLAEQMERLRAALDEASLSGDLSTLERLDPLWAERARWAAEPAASAGRRVPRWLVSPWPSLLVAAVVGAAVGGASLSALSSDREREVVDRAVAQRDVPTLERIEREAGPRSGMARGALDDIALRSSDPAVVLARLRHHSSSTLDEAAFQLAMSSPANDALWSYLAQGQQGSAAEQEILRRTLATGSRAALDDYRDRGGPSRPEIDEARQRLRLTDTLAKHDLRELRAIADDPAVLGAVRDDARHALQQAVDREVARLQTAHPGPLGELLRATLARQGTSSAPLKLVVRGDAPPEALRADDRTVTPDGLADVIRAQLASRLDASLPLELLRLEARGPLPAPEPHGRSLIKGHAALRVSGKEHSAPPSPGASSLFRSAGDALPLPDSTYLLVDYVLRPAGHERVDARLTVTLHSPDTLAVAPVALRFTSVNPAVRGDRLFADDLTDALQKSLDVGR